MDVSKADEDDKISSRREGGGALGKLLEDKDNSAPSTEFVLDDGKFTSTGLDSESVESDEEALLTAKGVGELTGRDDDGAAASLEVEEGSNNGADALSVPAVAGDGDNGGLADSGEGEGSITTTVVELFVSGRSGSKSKPSTGVTVQVVGVAAAMLLMIVELNTGEVEVSETEAEASDTDGSPDAEEVVLTPGLGDSKLIDEGSETVVVISELAGAVLDDSATSTEGDSITACADGVHDKAAATMGGGVTMGVANGVAIGLVLADEISEGGAEVGVVKNEDATVPDGGTTVGMGNNCVTSLAATRNTGREKWGAMLTDGGDVMEGMANLEVRLEGRGKLLTMDDLMSGAGAFVRPCVLTCLADFCRAGMADAVTMDGGSEMGKRFHGPGGKLSREEAAITAGGKVELERPKVSEEATAVFAL